MPYISDAEHERARWIPLAELIAHVAKHDGCNRASALKQICDALGDRKLHIKWQSEKPIHSDPEILVADWPPDDARAWQAAIIRRDRVFDPWAKRWRTLLILKHSIFRLWPGPSAKAGPITKVKSPGRPSARNDIHQALDRLSQQGLGVRGTPRKELEAWVAEKCGKRWTLRTVQKYIPGWLENH